MHQGVKELVNLSKVHFSEFLLRNVLRSQHGTAVCNIPGQMHKITVVMRCVKMCLSHFTHHTGAGIPWTKWKKKNLLKVNISQIQSQWGPWMGLFEELAKIWYRAGVNLPFPVPKHQLQPTLFKINQFVRAIEHLYGGMCLVIKVYNCSHFCSLAFNLTLVGEAILKTSGCLAETIA